MSGSASRKARWHKINTLDDEVMAKWLHHWGARVSSDRARPFATGVVQQQDSNKLC
jgi:hypothetical protein